MQIGKRKSLYSLELLEVSRQSVPFKSTQLVNSSSSIFQPAASQPLQLAGGNTTNLGIRKLLLPLDSNSQLLPNQTRTNPLIAKGSLLIAKSRVRSVSLIVTSSWKNAIVCGAYTRYWLPGSSEVVEFRGQVLVSRAGASAIEHRVLFNYE